MYQHIMRDQRVALAALLRAGHSQAEAARILGVHPGTVSRELRRNARSPGSYHAWNADLRATRRRRVSKRSFRKIENDAGLAMRIESLLHPLVSPEVVAHEVGLAHETIYAWIARSRPDLASELPYRGRKRRRYGTKRQAKQGWTKFVHPIDERPKTKERWEGDTVKGKGHARLLTHVERKSLFTVVDVLPRGTADLVHAAVMRRGFAGTITYDRGSEFALWRMIERDTRTKVFFAHPHHPWERGKNENTNGRLRRVFPKRFDFSTIAQSDIDAVVRLMNHTKRKSLNWRTPCAVFGRCCTSS
jgi:transposase, IS30 family